MKLISFLFFVFIVSAVLAASGTVSTQGGIALMAINLAAIILALPQKRK